MGFIPQRKRRELVDMPDVPMCDDYDFQKGYDGTEDAFKGLDEPTQLEFDFSEKGGV